MVKYWIKNISGSIEAVFLKLGTTNVHHKRNNATIITVAIATLSNQISPILATWLMDQYFQEHNLH